MSVVLSEHLPLLASAPEGIHKLRVLILELAVRGKLLPQDPNDEPASGLLKRIAKEPVALEVGATPKKNGPTPLDDGETLFKLPESWAWERLGNAVEVLDSLRKPVTKSDRKPGPYPYYGASGVVDYVSDFLFDEDLVLVGEDGAKWCAGDRTAFSISGKTWVNNHAHVLRPNRKVLIDSYLVHALVARDLQQFITGITVPKLNQAKLISIEIPVPPVAEQQRIVTKVDELMALCDQLEAEQVDAEAAHARLVETLLGTLTQSTGAAELAANWQRLAEHLDTLFTTEASLNALKQTILQLAVMGKLVPQDPNDEPASELLKRIAVEKTRLVREGRYRGGTTVTPIPTEDAPTPAPANWAWVPFGEIMISRDSERIPVSKDERTTRAKLYDYYGASGVIDKIDSYLFDKPLLLIGEDGANLINRSTPIAFIARGLYWVNNHAHVLDGISEGFLRFIELYINAIDLKPYVTGTAQPKMNQAKMNSIPIALPSESEQHRIVTKVDELMALVDRLKADLTESRTRQERLAATLIDASLQAA